MSEQAKKVYASPRLEVYGALPALTKAGSGTAMEGKGEDPSKGAYFRP